MNDPKIDPGTAPGPIPALRAFCAILGPKKEPKMTPKIDPKTTLEIY